MLPFLEESHDASRGTERHRAAAGEEQAVDAIERADRLQHHAERFTRRGPVVVDACSDRLIEEQHRAAGGPPRVGEVPDADAARRP